MGLSLTLFSQSQFIEDIYVTEYSEIPYGYVIATIYTFFIGSAHNYIILVYWFIIGLVLSLIEARPMFSIGLYISFYTFLLLYIPLLIYGKAVPPYTFYGEYVLISTFIFPLFINGIICGLGAHIGGRIRKSMRSKQVKEIRNDVFSSIPILCPHCGKVIYSNSLYCSNCGLEITKK